MVQSFFGEGVIMISNFGSHIYYERFYGFWLIIAFIENMSENFKNNFSFGKNIQVTEIDYILDIQRLATYNVIVVLWFQKRSSLWSIWPSRKQQKSGDYPCAEFRISARKIRSLEWWNLERHKDGMNESQNKRLEFWNKFNEVLEDSIDLVNWEHRIRVGLWIPDSKELFDRLYCEQEKIESEISFSLVWDRLDDKKASIVCTYIDGLDFNKQENYLDPMNKIIDYVVELKRLFKNYI